MPECTCKEFPENQRKMWCERHQCWKSKHWHELCQTRENYRLAWDAGRGPGQIKFRSTTPPKKNPDGKKLQTSVGHKTKGVGDHMKDVTAELKLTMKHGCGCKPLAAEMNRLGPDGCRLNRDKLVEKLKVNAKRYSWGDVMQAAVAAVLTGLAWKINPADVYGSLLDESIRRAENADKELKHADPN